MSFLNNFNKWRFFKMKKLSLTLKPKRLKFGLIGSGGRDNSGRISMYQRGGGHKRNYRMVDLTRDYFFFWNIPAVVCSIEYDPNRSAFLALILYGNGFFSYILSTENLSIGKVIILGFSEHFFEGDRVFVKTIPFGTKINNIKYWSRSAGCFSKYLGPAFDFYGIISLPSGKKKLIPFETLVTLGKLSNSSHYKRQLYKAGQNRWLSIRPYVRGVAKNPIDHPMGGGQGKTAGGRVSVTPWGFYTKGYKTKRKFYQKKKAMLLTI